MASISKKGNKYIVRWTILQNGKRCWRRRSFDLKRDATQFKTELESDSISGRQCEYSKVRLEDYLHDFFDQCSANLTGNTEHCSRRYMDNHIIPRIGNIRVRDLTAMDIQKAYNDILATPYRAAETKKIKGVEIVVKPARYYSAKTILNIHGVLTKALKHAVAVQHLIPYNPCDGVILPKSEDYEAFVPNREQMDALMDQMRQSRYYEALLADALLGIRRGECLGLFWSDLDFKTHEIHIQRALIYDEETHQLTLKDPKSKNSRRTLQIPPEMETILKDLKRRRSMLELEKSDVFTRSPFVFVTEDGLPIRPTTLSKEFKTVATAAGLPQMRLHDLRHTVTTYLLRAGLSPRAVQGVLGHQDARFTLKRYAQMLDDDKKEAASVIQSLYFKSKA
jgi:integrase